MIAKGTALLVAACAGSTAEVPVRTSPARAPLPKVRSEIVDAAKAWPVVLPGSPSRGHGDGRFVVEIRVSPAEADAVRNLVLGGTVPSGTSAVALHSRNGSKVVASAYAMRKRPGGDWEFEIVDPSGMLVERGPLPLCVRCHADAPADSLFVPRASHSTPIPAVITPDSQTSP